VTEVAAQVELGGGQAKVSEVGQLQLDPGAADLWRRIVHGVGNDHAAGVITRKGGQMLWMIAHPKRRQVQPHSRPPTRP
jgi:hypothetical protein